MTTTSRVLLLTLVLGPRLSAGELPLPDAPVRLVIPDAAAFDTALSGAFRSALTGEASAEDPLVAAFRQSQVGTKLEAQWEKLSGDLPWTWKEIRLLKPTRVGLSLLSAGNLEGVVVIETPLATFPASLPQGTSKPRGGVTTHLVASGAGDPGSTDTTRRAGLAWARSGGLLFLATSERALGLALDAAARGAAPAAPLPGLVSVDLDLDALMHDRYFRREFAFGAPGDKGHLRAALRIEAGNLVEVREGTGAAGDPGLVFDATGAAAAGWEPDGATFFAALRSGLLEPIPVVSEAPAASVRPLPAAQPGSEDRLLMNLEKPKTAQGQTPSEEGELAQWRELLGAQPVSGWGYWVSREGDRRIVFAWPAAQDDRLMALCLATVNRRAGRSSVSRVGDSLEIRVGPDLPALALRRTGGVMWIGSSAQSLREVPVPRAGGDLVRWALLDLDVVRAEGPKWHSAEGPASADRVRPFSDRLAGLLGWMPRERSLRVERLRTAEGWTERVTLGRAAQ